MKKALFFACLIFALVPAFGQDYFEEGYPEEESKERFSLTVGILQGGGSLVGADLEVLLSDYVGIQAGAGFIGYGAGLNVHLKPSIRSSFISLAYWHQGTGETHSQTVIGPTF